MLHCRAPENLKFGPIINNINAPTSRLSELLDEILKPLVQKLLGYCKDTFDFLEKIPRDIDNNTTFATFDAVALYTNIPHSLGLQAIDC